MIKAFLLYFALFCFICELKAQEKAKYYVTVRSIEGKKTVGLLVDINKDEIVIDVGKYFKNETELQHIPYGNIDKIVLRENRKNSGLFLLGAGGIAGSVVLGLNMVNPTVATVAIVGGSLTIIGFCVLIYKVANPPVLKLKRKEGLINYQNVSEALKVYISYHKQ